MSTALEALRRAPTDFAVTPDDIWDDHARPHVRGINEPVLRAIEGRIDAAERSLRSSVLGLPIIGEGGRGKSHCLGQARKMVQDRGGFFVRFNILDIDDFWSNLISSYLYAFNMRHREGATGMAYLLESLAERAGVPEELRHQLLVRRRPDPTSTAQFFEHVRNIDPALAGTRHTLRSLLLLHSSDELLAEVGDVFLNGGEVELEAAQGFTRPAPRPPREIVRDLSQLMAVCGATVIAVDQVDDIVRASRHSTDVTDRESARGLLQMLGSGLTDLRDNSRRSTVVLACLANTWKEFVSTAETTVGQRFVNPVPLDDTLPSAELAGRLLEAVLRPVYDEVGFVPPYPSYPFGPACLAEATHFSPRLLLKAASDHLGACVQRGEITEPERLDTGPPPELSGPPVRADGTELLDETFDRYRSEADLEPATSPGSEDQRMPRLLDSALQAYRVEIGRDRDSFDVRLPVGAKQHFHAEVCDKSASPKRHWFFKAIASANGNYVRPRVKGLYQWAGLGKDNPIADNHGILWVTAPQSEWGTWKADSQVAGHVAAFERDGTVVMASMDDLRVFDALRRMETERLPGYEAWLRARRPASETVLFRHVFGTPDPEEAPAAEPETERAETSGRSRGAGVVIDIPLQGARAHAVGVGGSVNLGAVGSGASASVGSVGSSSKGHIVIDSQTVEDPPQKDDGPPIGRLEGGATAHLDLPTMPKHTGVFAGSGSGKTVLLRRIIELCALQGISSIVLDPNNDLSRLGQAWPETPSTWLPGDAASAAEYRETTDVVIWTPGRNGGRPLSFQPLPDFAAVMEDSDEFDSAVDTAVASLAPRAMIDRSTAKFTQARAILRESLVAYARNGRSDFPGFLDFMAELPDTASSFDKADEIAAQIAATLRAVMVNDRVFAGSGESLDPGVLLRPANGKRARVSVINFLGLPTDEQRQGFVNQLELALFSWAKRDPAVDRPLSALLVLDEAQTLAPSSGSTICLESTLALVSQARKYGLGMVFATQSPKGVHNRIVGNCATHWYGRINAPAQISAAAEVAQQKGGSSVDLAHLSAGQFYRAADGRPTERVDVPMCLSHHPPTAPTAEEILASVRASGRGGAA